MSALAWLGFLAASAVGAPLRYLVDSAVRERTRGGFPWGIVVVNASGSLVLGVVAGLAVHGGARTVVGSGLCGAYTTFSTCSYDTVRLVEEGAPVKAVGNALGTLVVALGAAAVGLSLT